MQLFFITTQQIFYNFIYSTYEVYFTSTNFISSFGSTLYKYFIHNNLIILSNVKHHEKCEKCSSCLSYSPSTSLSFSSMLMSLRSVILACNEFVGSEAVTFKALPLDDASSVTWTPTVLLVVPWTARLLGGVVTVILTIGAPWRRNGIITPVAFIDFIIAKEWSTFIEAVVGEIDGVIGTSESTLLASSSLTTGFWYFWSPLILKSITVFFLASVVALTSASFVGYTVLNSGVSFRHSVRRGCTSRASSPLVSKNERNA